MFAALGNEVVTLHRGSIGGLSLEPVLPSGAWRLGGVADVEAVLTAPAEPELPVPAALAAGGIRSRRSDNAHMSAREEEDVDEGSSQRGTRLQRLRQQQQRQRRPRRPAAHAT